MSHTSPPAERPGRYNRSFGGLVGSMIVLVVAVVLAWLALGLFRDEAEFEPPSIDYDAAIEALTDSGAALAYPERLPEGWRVNNLDHDPDVPSFSLALLTDEEHFVGVYHGREELARVLARYVDEDPEQSGTVELTDGDGASGPWRVLTDEGGDTAYVRLGDQRRDPFVTMVYGTAPDEQLRAVVARLRTTG